MPPKRQKSSSEPATKAPLSSKKRPSEDISTPAKRRRAAGKDQSEATPASQRARRSSTKGTWDYGVKKTLEDEFREIVSATEKEADDELEGSELPQHELRNGHHIPVKAENAEDSSPVDSTKARSVKKSAPTKQDKDVKWASEKKSHGSEHLSVDQHSKKKIKATQEIGQQKAKHVRFGSEEPLDTAGLSEQPTSGTDAAIEEAEESSDDDAPEAVSHASAVAQAKSAAAEAAQAVDRMKAEEKRKRRQRDVLLKEQSRAAAQKKSKHLDAPEMSQSLVSGDFSSSITTDEKAETEGIPALLPDSLLARAGDVRPPTPDRDLVAPQVDPQLQKRKKHIKFIEEGEQRTKDVRKGPVNVRVLDKANTLMAPKKGDTSSRNLREFMLQGRYGDGSAKKYVKLQRKSVGGGFLKA